MRPRTPSEPDIDTIAVAGSVSHILEYLRYAINGCFIICTPIYACIAQAYHPESCFIGVSIQQKTSTPKSALVLTSSSQSTRQWKIISNSPSGACEVSICICKYILPILPIKRNSILRLAVQRICDAHGCCSDGCGRWSCG